jgi:hypothetical protein
MESCTIVPFMLTQSSLVAAMPTDVNWIVSSFPCVWSRERDGRLRSYTPDRELSDAMSAMVYNLDSAIALRSEKKPTPNSKSATRFFGGPTAEER